MIEAPAIQQLRLRDIMDDPELQSRQSLNTVAIEDYASELRAEAGLEFEPVVVFHDGKKYWLAHGFHRFRAYQHARRSSIPAEVREGTRREAILYSVGANARNGLRRTNADKRRAVTMLLRDPEWAGNSDSWIAEQCRVSHTLVADCRPSLADSASDRSRTVRTKHGTVTTMNTANIGRKPAPTAPVVPTGRSMTVEEYEAANGTGPTAKATGPSPSVPLPMGEGRQAQIDDHDDAERESNLAEALRALIPECERFPKYREVADAIRKAVIVAVA